MSNNNRDEIKENSKSVELELDLVDLDLVEKGLRYRLRMLSKEARNPNCKSLGNTQEILKIQSVLGQLHDQKVWYRPKQTTYLSG